MEHILSAVKFAAFLALGLSVLISIGAVVAAGVHQIIRDQVNESRRYDQIAPKAA
jgi:hypothetical protein